ncbi:uncharacterized protein EAF02_007945 [Botrytis sinoallii]|uniref:uncharacterized protein n=1 Tax=Botrytis sinoallii TaxID=1463999 RepID=UPI0018FFEB98|nr:uncharacterized protein EAF02_007945 [Botrytis sinoallii]KAF7879775.1 hypothetical protein EAF02_007945 [Botrytis sinoallii]
MVQYKNLILFLTVGMSAAFENSLPLALRQIRPTPHPNENYLYQMCYPNLANISLLIGSNGAEKRLQIMANSPFPCERSNYIIYACLANGTSPIDFLAEQECICPSSLWELETACTDCYLAHGYQNITREESDASISSLSQAECTATPVQPFTNFFSSVDASQALTTPDVVLGSDRFPNQTAVSNYYTGNTAWTIGSITGSATARLTSYTATESSRFTPTSTGAPYSTGMSGSASESAQTSTSGAGGLKSKMSSPGGVFGLGALLMQCMAVIFTAWIASC